MDNTPDIKAGMPNWVDLATPDLEGARAFYSGLFGWTPMVSVEPQAAGYTNFLLNDKAVAGVGPIMMADQPTAWTTYFASENADDTARMVEKAGGRTLVPPMDVLDYGRMAVFLDATGAAFATWQPGAHVGVEVTDVPGAMTWNELATRDTEGAKSFYGEVFGWDAQESQMGSIAYTTWKLDDREIAGMMPMVGDEWPAELPPHWMVYFAVADTDAVAEQATQLGGSVAVAPTDLPVGRFAVLSDPQGAFFAVIRMNEPARN
jgi:predicted enzyme related to lactoylglutathione lyase